MHFFGMILCVLLANNFPAIPEPLGIMRIQLGLSAVRTGVVLAMNH